MKKFSTVWITGIFVFISTIPVFSQGTDEIKTTFIKPYPLTITTSKTTNLIFPCAIKSVDRGTGDVLAQKADEVQNILQIKAAKEDFKPTNLTVITSDGKLYSFLLQYSSEPSILNLILDAAFAKSEKILFSRESYNEEEIKTYSGKVLSESSVLHGIKDEKYGIILRQNGIFIHNGIMYYRIKIENLSAIGYDIDQWRFFIRDEKKAKRTASQELEITPLFIQNDTSVIAGKSVHDFVFAFSKFTIPDKKYLVIQLMEKGGGRHFNLKVHNRKLIRAIMLPEKGEAEEPL